MIQYIKKFGQLALLAGLTTSCYIDPTAVTPLATTTPTTPPSSGTASFAKYIAIGNSITAGYSNGGVYRAGQMVAFPNLLSQQFYKAQQGNSGAIAPATYFPQPLYSEAQKDGTGYLVLRNIPVPAPNIQSFGPGSTGFMSGIRQTTPNVLFAKHSGANNNFGVPGIRIDNVNIPGYGALNPHFERLLADGDVATKTYRQYVMDNGAGATFFSLWLGNNDALGYAISGATGATPFSNTLTDLATFQASYNSMLDALVGGMPAGLGVSKGVLVTVPNVTLLPYFTTITHARLLAQLQAANAAITGFYIETSGGARLATANDRFLLGSQAEYGKFGQPDGNGIPYGLHPLNPLKSSAVLDEAEVTAINTRIGEFNAHITNEATARGLALFNANALLTTASTTGYFSNNVLYRGSFISGGVFSLDGVHLTEAGNAIIANEIIKTINTKYTSSIPLLNTSMYRGVFVTPF